MVFGLLDFTDYSVWITTIIVGSFVILFVNYFISLFSDELSYFIFFMVLMIGAWGIASSYNKIQSANEENSEKAAANVMQKYDVMNIKFPETKTITRLPDADTEGEVLVIGTDGAAYKFQYQVDEYTSEPTLITIPESTVPAEALLRR